jgi:signal transduction histidine kinase
MITFRDLSSWIELERHKNISLMKTKSFAQAAHEFRNPLNSII